MRRDPSMMPREIELQAGPERALELDLSQAPPARLHAAAASAEAPAIAVDVRGRATSHAPFGSFAPSRWDRLNDAFAEIHLGVWKRLATYPLLALAVGNGCTCRSLSGTTNALLGALVVLGAFGVYACTRDQRSW